MGGCGWRRGGCGWRRGAEIADRGRGRRLEGGRSWRGVPKSQQFSRNLKLTPVGDFTYPTEGWGLTLLPAGTRADLGADYFLMTDGRPTVQHLVQTPIWNSFTHPATKAKGRARPSPVGPLGCLIPP
eukprot:1192317-Prorocentrum_minimum.AAC.2